MSSVALRTRYPWNDVNRLQLVEVVRQVKGEAKNHSLKWREVARRLHNDSDMEESMFGRLCAKQFDNLYRAYMKFKQDGDQPPRLTIEVIEEFDELFPGMGMEEKPLEGERTGGSLDTKSTSRDTTTQKSMGKKVRTKVSWTTASRLNLLSAVRSAATSEGKIHWAEVVASLPDDFGISEDRLSMLCMKQFTDLSFRYKEFKEIGSQPRRLTVEIIQTLEDLYENLPNLNPLPVGGQDVFGNDREEVAQDRTINTPSASNHELEQRSSSRHDDPPINIPACEPSSESKRDPSPDSNREEDETTPPRNNMAHLGKRKERTEMSSSQTDTSSHGEYIDEQEIGFERMNRELLLLPSWLKQEVIPVVGEVLARVKANGRRNHGGKRSKDGSHSDFDKLIDRASQKSTVLAIRAQFQKVRANVLKEVKETIERVGMDLLNKRASPFENGQHGLPSHSQGGPSRPG